MPTLKKKVTTSKRVAAKPTNQAVTKEVTVVTKPEKAPRGYEYKQFLVKKTS